MSPEIKRVRCEVNPRNEKGQFVPTTRSTRYKKSQLNGRTMNTHRKIWIQHNGEIQKGMIIHHINGKTKDNRITNLKMMTIDEHNKLHLSGSIPWNKGKKCPNISQSKMGHKVTEAHIKKCKDTWKNKYLDSMREIAKLVEQGLSIKEISKYLHLSYFTTYHRLRKYRRDYI